MGMSYYYVGFFSPKLGNRIEETKRTEKKQGEKSNNGTKRGFSMMMKKLTQNKN